MKILKTKYKKFDNEFGPQYKAEYNSFNIANKQKLRIVKYCCS